MSTEAPLTPKLIQTFLFRIAFDNLDSLGTRVSATPDKDPLSLTHSCPGPEPVARSPSSSPPSADMSRPRRTRPCVPCPISCSTLQGQYAPLPSAPTKYWLIIFRPVSGSLSRRSWGVSILAKGSAQVWRIASGHLHVYFRVGRRSAVLRECRGLFLARLALERACAENTGTVLSSARSTTREQPGRADEAVVLGARGR